VPVSNSYYESVCGGDRFAHCFCIDAEGQCEMGLASLVVYPRLWTNRAYNEITFRHFLVLEHNRSEYSSRSFVLILVRLRKTPGISRNMSPSVSASIFSTLELCVRETDFVGWFSESRVVGAVLTQSAAIPAGVSSGIADRVLQALEERLPPRVAQLVRVRVVLRPKTRH
jgi:hypothetical protein